MNPVSKWPIFQHFLVHFVRNRSKQIPKIRIFNVADFFESKQMQSNEPSVKMAIFSIFSVDF